MDVGDSCALCRNPLVFGDDSDESEEVDSSEGVMV